HVQHYVATSRGARSNAARVRAQGRAPRSCRDKNGIGGAAAHQANQAFFKGQPRIDTSCSEMVGVAHYGHTNAMILGQGHRSAHTEFPGGMAKAGTTVNQSCCAQSPDNYWFRV